jgi:hypothetical protein
MDDKEALERGADALLQRDELRKVADAIARQVDVLHRAAWQSNDKFIDCALALAGIDGGDCRDLTDGEKQRLVAARQVIEQHAAQRSGQKPPTTS